MIDLIAEYPHNTATVLFGVVAACLCAVAWWAARNLPKWLAYLLWILAALLAVAAVREAIMPEHPL